METISVKFLSKQVELPADLKEYRKILDMAIESHQQMFELFAKRVLKTERKAIEDEELISILKPQAEKFVKCLCDKGVFSQTINDYLVEIPGYSEVLSTNQRALQATFDFLREEALGFVRGVEEAERSAQSKVTGSGVSVWSNSFTTLASFAALDYFSAKRQVKEASAEYKQEIEKLEQYGKTQTERKTIQYLKTHYFPDMEKAMSVFAFGMMDKYLNTLINEKKFNESTLQYVDLKRSNDLLDNLKLSSSIETILENAFVACPFNVKIFIVATQYGKLDNDMLQIIQVLNLNDEIKMEYTKFLTDSKNCEPNYEFLSFLEKAETIVFLLSKVENNNAKKYYRQLSWGVYNKIIAGYNKVKKISDVTLAQSILLKLSAQKISLLTPEQLPEIVSKEILYIVDQRVFDILISKCGYTTLLLDISPDIDQKKFISKNEIDHYYISHIVELLAKDFESTKNTLIAKKKLATTTSNQNSGGCYIATCVYGSYDCPSVWTLRRYRDYELANSWSGRAFIRVYYAISPKIVKCFGETCWFKSLWRKKLDKMVNKLQAKGVSCEPYDDRKW